MKKHGPFVRISHEEVSVCHRDAVRQILLNILHKSKWYGVVALPDHRFQTPMSETDPKRHVQRARNLTAGFAFSHVIKSESHIDECIHSLKARLVEFSLAKVPIDLDEWFNYLAFDILGELLFSQAFGFLENGKDIGESIANSKVLTLYVTLAGFFQGIHHLTLGNPIVSDMKLLPAQHIFDTTLRAIESRQGNPEVRKDMLSLWMKQHEEHPDKMSEKELLGCVNMTVGAGADTVSTSLQSFFYHLIRRPEHLARLRTEICDANLTEDVISYADAAKLPFLQACIKEAWRIPPPVSFGLGRVTPLGGISVGGHFFQAGTILSVNPHVIHYSRELFGEDAAVYNPDRWLGPHAKEIEKYYIAFGAGYNSCQGRNIAQLEVTKVTATLVRDFDFRWPCFVKRQ